MDFQKITVTEIYGAVTVYSEKGRYDKMTNRKSYGLSLCESGQITYLQDEKEYVSEPNCVVILPKGGNYEIRGDKTGSFPVINFDCSDFLCDTVTVIPIQNAQSLLADYERIKKLFYFDGNRARRFGIFYEMIHKLCSDDLPRVLQSAVHLIDHAYCDPTLTNAKLAAECQISEVYFRKLFTKHFGVSPKQFVIDVRLQKAKQLLSEGALSVAEISEQCGFSNAYHFCRIFKQHTGSAPSEYRKKNLNCKI